MRRRLLVFLAVLVFLPSCIKESGSEDFLVPDTIEATFSVSGRDVLLRGVVSSQRVDNYGFCFGEKSQSSLQIIPAVKTISEDAFSFEASVVDLIPGTDYIFFAYAEAGKKQKITSDTLSFTVNKAFVAIEVEDPVFKQYLLDEFDKDGNGVITLSEAEEIQSIEVCTDAISSLGGIENMPSLERLSCRGSSDEKKGSLSDLNIIGNTKLKYIDCSYNEIGSLDLSLLSGLEELDCSGNAIEVLNLYLNESLDVDKTVISPMADADGNPLPRIVTLPPSRQDLVSVVPEGALVAFSQDPLDAEIPIEDPVFESYLVRNFDEDGNGSISLGEARNIHIIDMFSDRVTSLAGIEYMTNLEHLSCTGSSKVKEQSRQRDYASGRGALTRLDLRYNKLLTDLDCSCNSLVELDLTSNTSLDRVQVSQNFLKELKLPPSMSFLFCNDNELETLDLSDCNIWSVNLDNNRLKSLDLSGCSIWSVSVNNNQLESFDISGASLNGLECDDNKLEHLDLTNAPEDLVNLSISGNRLTSLDLTKLPNLVSLHCTNNKIESLDLSRNLGIDVEETEITQEEYVIEIEPGVPEFYSYFKRVYLSPLRPDVERIVPPGVEIIYVSDSSSGSDVAVPIKDPVFKQYLVEIYDRDYDGEISLNEAGNIRSIRVYTDNITSLGGIEYMPNLTSLFCRSSSDDGHGGLTGLDLSGNPLLSFLDCSYNSLETLDLTPLPDLEELHCNDNELEELDLTRNQFLRIACISVNHFSSLDLGANLALTDLHLDNNLLEELDLSNNVNLSVYDVHLYPNPLKIVYLPSSRQDLEVLVPNGVKIVYR